MRYLWLLAFLGIVVGLTAVAAASRSTTPLTTDGVREREASAADVVADAVLKAGEAQAALLAASQFKTGTVNAGRVATADVTALLVKPERGWVVSNISGEGLRAALERSLSQAPEESAHFLQVAGLKLEYDPKAPAGHRITRLTLGGQEVQAGTRYRVAMTEDLAKGGSGYFVVPDFNENNIVPGRSGTVETAVGAFLEATPELKYPKPGGPPERIVPT